MDPAALRWKRPWEDAHAHTPSLHQQHHHHHPSSPPHHVQLTPPSANSAPPAPHEAGSAPPWTSRARRESSVQPLYLAESPSGPQNNKRRRLLPDQIPHSAESAGYLGSGEEYDDERGRQQLQPASPGMVSAHGFVPMVSSQDDKACCSPACTGLTCVRRRALIHEIVAEIESLNLVLRSDSQPRSHSSRAATLGTDQALVFAVDLLRSNVNNLRDQAAQPSQPLGEGLDFQPATAELRDIMKRRFDPTANSDVPPFLPQPQRGDRDPIRAIPPSGHPEDIRRSFQSSRDPLSPRHSPTGPHSTHSGNNFTRPPSPTHNHHPHRMLPSPTSLNIVAPPSTIHSLSSPTPSSLYPQQQQQQQQHPQQHQQPPPSTSSAAHTAHLQDLQHQLSLKTLALQSLRQEYDALLAKLDRQRTRCAALERKFEVSDMELNALTTDKEELEARVAQLERLAAALRAQRDDAARREVSTAAQYRSIVEMAGRLQGIAAEEKRAWVREREGLLRALGWGDTEGDGGGGSGQLSQPPGSQASTTTTTSTADLDLAGAAAEDALPPPPQPPDQGQDQAASAQVIAALRVEVARLRSRTQCLEEAIRDICERGASMEEAAMAAAEAGKRMREAARRAVGDA